MAHGVELFRFHCYYFMTIRPTKYAVSPRVHSTAYTVFVCYRLTYYLGEGQIDGTDLESKLRMAADGPGFISFRDQTKAP